jgi:hypothetical protein
MNAIKEDPDATVSEGEVLDPAPSAPPCACCAQEQRAPSNSYCSGCATFRSSFTGAKEILSAEGIDVDKVVLFAFKGAKTSHADFIRSMVRARGRAKGARAIAEEIKAHLLTLNVRVRGTKRTLSDINADAAAASALMQLGGPNGPNGPNGPTVAGPADQVAESSTRARTESATQCTLAAHSCLLTSMMSAIKAESTLRAGRRQLTAALEVATQLRDACSAYLDNLKALAPTGDAAVADTIARTEADLTNKEAVRAAAADALESAPPIDPMVEATNAAFDEINNKIREAAAYTERMRR